MPWQRNDPDPLEDKRRKLAEMERQLAEQRSRLMNELNGDGPEDAKQAEPPVWRLEDDGSHHRAAEPTPARKRHLARQRQRDMILVILLLLIFLAVLIMAVWIAYAHISAPANNGF